MDSKQSNFGDELRNIDDEVRVDVDKILRLATATLSQPEASNAKTKASEKQPIQLEPINRENRQASSRKPKSDKHVVFDHPIRDNVTTRLTRKTNEQLTEAALKQKLKKAKPDTRQDIIEAAIIEWLKKT